MKINLDVLGALMLDGVGEHIDNTDVVWRDKEGRGVLRGVSSKRSWPSHVEAPFAIAQYSVSTLNLETML